mmetsp:Transcript_45261/g.107931  ORF Transcript_45261/g.107931 Transcript_45261/m.107931 type:complete len:294 (-) Transcript_45261:179-1060(-)
MMGASLASETGGRRSCICSWVICPTSRICSWVICPTSRARIRRATISSLPLAAMNLAFACGSFTIRYVQLDRSPRSSNSCVQRLTRSVTARSLATVMTASARLVPSRLCSLTINSRLCGAVASTGGGRLSTLAIDAWVIAASAAWMRGASPAAWSRHQRLCIAGGSELRTLCTRRACCASKEPDLPPDGSFSLSFGKRIVSLFPAWTGSEMKNSSHAALTSRSELKRQSPLGFPFNMLSGCHREKKTSWIMSCSATSGRRKRIIESCASKRCSGCANFASAAFRRTSIGTRRL